MKTMIPISKLMPKYCELFGAIKFISNVVCGTPYNKNCESVQSKLERLLFHWGHVFVCTHSRYHKFVLSCYRNNLCRRKIKTFYFGLSHTSIWLISWSYHDCVDFSALLDRAPGWKCCGRFAVRFHFRNQCDPS